MSLTNSAMYPPLTVIVFSIESLIMYGVQLTDGGVTPKEVEVIANEMCSQDFDGKYKYYLSLFDYVSLFCIFSIFSYNLHPSSTAGYY